MKAIGWMLVLFPFTLFASDYGSVALKKEDVLDVVNGQIFRVNIKQWQPIVGENIEVRLRGLIAPDVDGACEKEIALATDSRNFSYKLLMNSENIILEEIARDPTGFRLIADVIVDEVALGSALLNAGLARNTGDEGDATWCDIRADNLSINDGTFSGEVLDGIPSGTGTWTSNDGQQKYVGEWEDGLWHGEGTHSGSDGSINSGGYQHGRRHGQSSWIHPDGRKYVGEYRDDQMHGQGVHTFSNGDIYSGVFENGRQHGKGTYTFADGSVVVGDWKTGRPWHAEYSDDSGQLIGQYVDGNWKELSD